MQIWKFLAGLSFAALLTIAFITAVSVLGNGEPKKLEPIDVLKLQVLVERSGRIKAEYEKMQGEIQGEIMRETERMYQEAGLKRSEFSIDLKQGTFVPNKEEVKK